MTSVNIDIRHPRVLLMFNQMHAELRRTDDAYVSGSFSNIKHANSELLALLQALIKKTRNNSTERNMNKILEENAARRP